MNIRRFHLDFAVTETPSDFQFVRFSPFQSDPTSSPQSALDAQTQQLTIQFPTLSALALASYRSHQLHGTQQLFELGRVFHPADSGGE